jgi:NADH-quinone oxidoreductase subunit G
VSALAAAAFVVALSSFGDGAVRDYADAILPIAPFSETSGSFVNTEGRIQSFSGVVRPFGDARPGWKVLRVLGNLLDLDGFSYETSEQVRADITPSGEGFVAGLGNGLSGYGRAVPCGRGQGGWFSDIDGRA